jgi:hypothetical protein
MAQRELVFWSHIEDRNQIVTQARDQVITRDRLKSITGAEVVGHHATDLGNVPFTDAAERIDQGRHFGIAGEAIENVLAATLGFHETRASQDLQVARGVGERQMCFGRQPFNRADSLREVLQQLKPVSVAERLRDCRKIFIDRFFWSRA